MQYMWFKCFIRAWLIREEKISKYSVQNVFQLINNDFNFYPCSHREKVAVILSPVKSIFQWPRFSLRTNGYDLKKKKAAWTTLSLSHEIWTVLIRHEQQPCILCAFVTITFFIVEELLIYISELLVCHIISLDWIQCLWIQSIFFWCMGMRTQILMSVHCIRHKFLIIFLFWNFKDNFFYPYTPTSLHYKGSQKNCYYN